MSGDRALPDWLTAGLVPRLIGAVAIDGDEVRVVGGAVRNWLAGMPPGDLDLATTALPHEVVARVEAAGFRAVPTGIEHGTVTVVAEGAGCEVTTLRRDVETDGRRARVSFGRDWQADAARRDFTINAMSLSSDGRLHDYFGGRDDLERGRVRFIGEAIQRVREDRLRILRLFRFHAVYGRGAVDREALHAAIAERAGLALLSRERIRAEILKLLAAERAAEVLQVMADAGLLDRILGGVPLCAGVARLAAIEAALGRPADPALRLAALAVLVREDAQRLRERLALSNEELRRLDGVGHGWRQAEAGLEPGPAKALLHAVGSRGYRDRLMVAFARSGADAADPGWRTALALPERWRPPVFPVTGEMLLAHGVPAGPDLGARLARLRQLWVAADFPTDRGAVLELVERVLRA